MKGKITKKGNKMGSKIELKRVSQVRISKIIRLVRIRNWITLYINFTLPKRSAYPTQISIKNTKR